MNVEHLVEMANQIGSFFDSQGTTAQAIDGIADHLRRFWEPRMLRTIGDYVRSGGTGLTATVAEAVRRVAPAAASP